MASKPKARPKKKPAKKPAKKPETRGRPTKYNASWAPRMALIMASSGMIDKDMAESMGVHKSTFDKWKNDHPEFGKALTKGKQGPNEELEAALFKSGKGYFVDEVTQYHDTDGNESWYDDPQMDQARRNLSHFRAHQPEARRLEAHETGRDTRDHRRNRENYSGCA